MTSYYDGLDAGHGGNDPGAVSQVRPALGDKLYTEEEDITLDIVKRLECLLLACGDKVLVTRKSDVSLSLKQRSDMLNAAGVDNVVSIHLNSSTDALPNYISTFIQCAGDKGEQLAKCIQPLIVRESGWKDGGIRVANLHMNRETKAPSVLIEIGFLSNPAQEKLLNEPGFRQRIATAIAEGIMTYHGGIVSWQRRLLEYARDSRAGQIELDRCQRVWRQKIIARDIAGAETTHHWANQVRQAMFLPLE